MTMNRLIVICAFLLVSSSLAIGQDSNILTSEISQHLLDDKIGKVHKRFSPKTKKKFKKVFLVNVWNSIQKNNGKLVSIGKTNVSNTNGKSTITLPLTFENASLNLVVTANESNEIIGLVFTPLAYETPDWAKNKIIGKERLKVTTDTFKLPGELMVPENCNQCPVVILVHGSGPSDRNEGSSMSPNRLFQDLAYGFALNGIATLRYDKRTHVYQKQLTNVDSFTLYEETIDDAVSAVRLSRSYDFLDTSRIYVLGHSLGAYASPLIAKEDPNIKGIIMLAGPYRPLYEIIPEQYEYILGLDGQITKKEQKLITMMEEEVKFINEQTSEATKLKALGSDKLLPYFRQMRDYNPTNTINDLNCRVLITQGDRDYQVQYTTEYQQYQSTLTSNPNVDFKLIPGVNHQLIWGESPSIPSEYYKLGHPDLKVITELSNWILEK